MPEIDFAIAGKTRDGYWVCQVDLGDGTGRDVARGPDGVWYKLDLAAAPGRKLGEPLNVPSVTAGFDEEIARFAEKTLDIYVQQ